MTTYNKASLKTFFEQGDVPQGADYANFIDSCINIVETAAQTMAGALVTTKLITPLVSATTLNTESLNVSASNSITLNSDNNITIDASNNVGVSAAGNLSLNSDAGITVSAGVNISFLANTNITMTTNNDITLAADNNITITPDNLFTVNGFAVVSALTVNTDIVASAGTIYASATRSPSGYFGNGVTPIVSAAGTTQGAATIITASPLVRGQGTADGTTTGYALAGNRIGMFQYFIHEGAVSGNLWPPTGGTINALSTNTPFPLAANTMYTVLCKSASAYAVK
jgi:hypothetical protein